jgi:pimeloyl-ACP methyl ester carboxylesterase
MSMMSILFEQVRAFCGRSYMLFFLLLSQLLISGCSTVGETGMFLVHLNYPSERFEFTLSNGATRTWHHFVTGDGSDGTIIFIPGSGCRSTDYARFWLSKLTGSFHVVALEKAGVTPGSVRAGGCSERFLEEHRLASYSHDLSEFAQFVWKKFPNRNRILFGISEGGWVAADLADRSAATHVVLLSSGGGTGLERLLLQAQIRGGEAEVERTRDYYSQINRRDDLNSFVFGDYQGDYSVGYLQEVLAVRPEARLNASRASFLVAHGGRDDVVPPQLAIRLCERLNSLKNDAMYFYEPEGDHGLSTPDRQSGYRFFSAFLAWVEKRPSPYLSRACPYPEAVR